MWKGCVWASDQAGSQLVAVNPETGSVQTVKLGAGSFPYTLTVGPDDSLWFTEVFASRIGRIDEQLHLHEYLLPVAGTPAQIVFVNDALGYYVDTGNVGFVKPAIFSFDPRSFSPIKVASGETLRAPTSLALVGDGVWLTQHATSHLAFYDFNSHEWFFFPTSPVSYQATTLPYFVAANGSLIWFNEHYANRMARLDTEHGLLTEYSLSDPPASKITGIDNALTFALGKDKVWFTELTADYVGFVDAAYKPNFTISPANNPNIKLRPGGNINVTFTVSGQSEQPLMVQFADTEKATGRPQRIFNNANVTEIESFNGRKTIAVKITADKTIQVGNYTLLITVTDGLTYQGAYIRLQITT
jgi:streptogramin lyase